MNLDFEPKKLSYYLLSFVSFLCLTMQIMNELQGIEQIPGPDPLYNDICFSGPERYFCFLLDL